MLLFLGALERTCNGDTNSWFLLYATQISDNFIKYELRQHKLAHTKPFHCFRLSFSKDDTQETIQVAELDLAHSRKMPKLDEFCGRPTHKKDFPRYQDRVANAGPCPLGACPWQAAFIYDDAYDF